MTNRNNNKLGRNKNQTGGRGGQGACGKGRKRDGSGPNYVRGKNDKKF